MKNKNNRFLLMIILMIVITIGFTFAYFSPSIISGEIFSTGGTSVEEKTDDITLLNADEVLTSTNKYPMTEEVAMNAITPYTFQVRNNSTTKPVTYNIIVEAKSANTITKDSLIDTKINNNNKVRLTARINPIDSGYSNAYIIGSDTLSAGETKTYDLRLWINELGDNIEGSENNVENRSWSGKIVVMVPTPVRWSIVSGNIDTAGSQVRLGSVELGYQYFRILNHENGKLKLLGEYNLYAGNIVSNYSTVGTISETDPDYMMQKDSIGVYVEGETFYGAVPFMSDEVYNTTYNGNFSSDTDKILYEGSNVEAYTKEYIVKLGTKYGLDISNIEDSYVKSNELTNFGSQDWFSTTSYWLSDFAGSINNYVHIVLTGANYNYVSIYSNEMDYGVRPVIIVNDSLF